MKHFSQTTKANPSGPQGSNFSASALLTMGKLGQLSLPTALAAVLLLLFAIVVCGELLWQPDKAISSQIAGVASGAEPCASANSIQQSLAVVPGTSADGGSASIDKANLDVVSDSPKAEGYGYYYKYLPLILIPVVGVISILVCWSTFTPALYLGEDNLAPYEIVGHLQARTQRLLDSSSLTLEQAKHLSSQAGSHLNAIAHYYGNNAFTHQALPHDIVHRGLLYNYQQDSYRFMDINLLDNGLMEKCVAYSDMRYYKDVFQACLEELAQRGVGNG